MTNSEYEVVNCLLNTDNHRLCVVKTKGGNEQFLMKYCKFKDSSLELGRRNRYKRELEFISIFDHPNIFKPISSENVDSSLSIIYQFRKGTTLQRFFTAKVTLSVAEKLKMIIQLIEALEHIHSRGIVHGDLHPGNIFVREDRGVEIYDFSMCMTVEEVACRQDGLVIGTYPYLSPEQTGFTRFKVDTRSDLYCAGLILYQLLSNRFPFASQNGTIEELLDYMLKTELEPIRSIPYYINEILLKALRSTPEERYQTASGMKYDLKLALDIIQNQTVSQELIPGEKDTIIAVSRLRYFIAREKEIEQLNKGLMALKQKESSSFLLTGASGIGKSEVIRSFLSSEQMDSLYVITAKCNRFTPNQPYCALRCLMLEFLTKLQEKDTKDKAQLRANLNSIYKEHRGLICNVIPEMRGFFDSAQNENQIDIENETEKISYILISILDTICASFPVIFVIDDVQWIDAPSFELLMRFKSSDTSKMMIFAYRTDNNGQHQLYKYSLNEIADKRIDIQPFTRNETVWLVYSIFDQMKNEEILIDVLEHKCNGNPFMLNQMLRYLLDSSIIRKVKESWVFIPELISEIPGNFDSVSLVQHKLANLSEKELRYLKIGSLMGGVLELRILEEIGGYDEELAKSILKRLETEGLLITNFKGEVRFAHDKIQEVVQATVPADEKRLIYEALAVEYEALSDTKMEFLFDAAEMYRRTSQLNKAIELSVRAGKYAVEKAAYELAITDFRNALLMIDQTAHDEVCSGFDKSEIELSLAEVLMLTGKYEQALHIYTTYSNDNRVPNYDKCEIYYKIGCIYLNMGEYLQARDVFKNALSLLGYSTGKSRIQALFQAVIYILCKIVYCSPLKKMLSIKDSSSKRLEVKLLNKYCKSLMLTSDNIYTQPHVKALNVSLRLDDCVEKMETLLLHSLVCYQNFFKRKAFRYCQKVSQYISSSGKKHLTAYLNVVSGTLHYYSAHWKSSEKDFLQSIGEYKAKSDILNQITSLDYLWRIFLHKGDLNRSLEHLTHAISLSSHSHQKIETKPLAAAKALIELIASGKDVETQKEYMSYFYADLKSPFNIHAQIKALQLEYELRNEHYTEAWRTSSELLRMFPKGKNVPEYAVSFYSNTCELIVRELVNEKIAKGFRHDRTKLLTQFRKLLKHLTFLSIQYPAFRGGMFRFWGWFFYLKFNNKKISGYLFRKSIRECHKLSMRLEEARSICDYGVFNELCNLPGIAVDYFDQAFTIYKQCGAKLELLHILEKVNPEVRKKYIDDSAKIDLNAAENSNQIRFDTLHQLSSSITEISDLPVLFNQILSGMIKATGAQYGCIFVRGQDGHLKCMLNLDFQGNRLSDNDIVISRSIVDKAEQNRQVLLVNDGVGEFIKKERDTERIRSVLCVPLYREDNFLGCVYLGNDKVSGLFSENAVKTVQIISAHAGILLENAYLMEKYKMLNRELDTKVKQQTHDMLEKNRQLEVANLKLVESERVKGVLSGTLVHDIKNYAAGIEGNLQYLGRKLEHDTKVKRVLDVVSETCSDIVSLASNLLDIAKMDEGKLVVRPETLDCSFISTIAEKFSINTLFEEKEIQPVIFKNTENFSVYADVYLLERVIQNLFSNAAKYVPRKGRVELRFETTETENLLCFYNSGIAIPEKEREVLFEKYARIENHHSQYSKGLGLFFCRMVMNAHKGRIWVETDDSGNHFKLAFPHKNIK